MSRHNEWCHWWQHACNTWLPEAGVMQKKLADEYRIGRSTVGDIKKNEDKIKSFALTMESMAISKKGWKIMHLANDDTYTSYVWSGGWRWHPVHKVYWQLQVNHSRVMQGNGQTPSLVYCKMYSQSSTNLSFKVEKIEHKYQFCSFFLSFSIQISQNYRQCTNILCIKQPQYYAKFALSSLELPASYDWWAMVPNMTSTASRVKLFLVSWCSRQTLVKTSLMPSSIKGKQNTWCTSQ